MNLHRPFAAAVLAAVSFAALSCSDGSGPNVTLPNAAALAAQLDTIDAAFASPQLQSLSRLALPLLAAGIGIHTMDTFFLGRTVEWDAIHEQETFTSRTGAPANALRVILYTLDSTGLPAFPRAEIGWVDLIPVNQFNGGRPDSMSLEFVVAQTTPSYAIVAHFTATRVPADTACGQCATISGVVGTGPRSTSFTIPYYIPLNADGNFAGVFTSAGFEFAHGATLPGPVSTSATARLALSFRGDSITATSGPLHKHGAELDGESEVKINGEYFATVRRTAGSTTVTGLSDFTLMPATRRAAGGLFAVPADIADYIEWPTFVIFFCGC